MDEKELIRARLTELDRLAYERNILKTSGFLSYAEQQAYHQLQKAGSFLTPTHFLGGGYEESERAAAFFLPDYMDKAEAEGAKIAVLKAEVPGEKYAEELTHRDYLGALMNLGIDRGQIGDILIDRTDSSACCFVLKTMTGYICRELCRVKHTTVLAAEIPPGKCTVRPEFEEREGSVASERLDAVLALVFRLARGKAQELIDREAVIVDGSTAHSGGFPLKAGSRVSVRGFGKFIYAGVVTSTKKGRLLVHVKVFK